MAARERSSMDEVLAVYCQGVDVTLLRENLKLTVPQRMEKFEEFMRGLDALRASRAREIRHEG